MNDVLKNPIIDQIDADTALNKFSLVKDAEYFATAVAPDLPNRLTPLNVLNKNIAAIPGVFESSLPEIQTLALLIAARRFKEGEGAARLTDAADWLAARIMLLDVSYVAVSLRELALLEMANQRCQAFLSERALPFMSALPLLREHTQPDGVQTLITRQPLYSVYRQSFCTQEIKAICQQRFTAFVYAQHNLVRRPMEKSDAVSCAIFFATEAVE